MTEGVLFMYESMIDTNQSWKQGISALFQSLKIRGIPFLIMTRVQQQQTLLAEHIVEKNRCYPVYYKDDDSFAKAAQILDLELKQCIIVSNQKETQGSEHHIMAKEKNGYDLMAELMMQLL